MMLRPGIGIDKFAGINVTLSSIASLAFLSNDDPLGLPWPRERMIFAPPEPLQRYDFVSTLPEGAIEALQRELKTKLGFMGRKESTNMEVLLLRVKNPSARGLTISTNSGLGDFSDSDDGERHHFKIDHLSLLPRIIERYFKMPIIDLTGSKPEYSADFKWRESDGPDALKQVLLNDCGLELVSGRELVEMLVVEKAI